MKRIVSIAVLLVALAQAVPANANHLPAFGPAWPVNPTIHPATSYPWSSGDWSGRVLDARAEWVAIGTGRSISWSSTTVAHYNITNTCGTTNVIAMMYQQLDDWGWPNALGLTNYCTTSGTRTSAGVAVDVRFDLYTGTGDAKDPLLGIYCNNCEYDLWSILTHELGHAMGGNHFSEDDAACPNSDARETMCPGIYAGTERQRTYEPHEEASFRAWNP